MVRSVELDEEAGGGAGRKPEELTASRGVGDVTKVVQVVSRHHERNQAAGVRAPQSRRQREPGVAQRQLAVAKREPADRRRARAADATTVTAVQAALTRQHLI